VINGGFCWCYQESSRRQSAGHQAGLYLGFASCVHWFCGSLLFGLVGFQGRRVCAIRFAQVKSGSSRAASLAKEALAGLWQHKFRQVEHHGTGL